MLQVNTLHGYKLEDLIELQNKTKSSYTKIALQAIRGFSNDEIIKSPALSKVSIVSHVKRWNILGF
ncbi:MULTISPECIES: hypothetical protein [Clostridium]|uniref:Uncharacterized protein n=2 Tax=Clostridium TaxID=1485 RepID=D8GNT7_CLOLD|nr:MULTISPECIES: hypothetical protein [Clostridium]ADK13783.1 hypothetical protein CLJU_c07130 [Clostridium ljungdahlii DSM 13528]ALU37154.1 Hypothetical protein CLAU_2727 [Clostridium autoethanogenum DSM 10061]OAA85031.1 hypothetical protein WX45_00789 [Clostridium ljungdahlii DSM 13528]OVY50273.1 hypothetical protein WX72_03034 [Clostridium autoethanogenum]